MTDIFEEVEEDLQRERIATLWNKYGWQTVIGLGIALLIAAGVVAWQEYQHSQAREASRKYQDMLAPGEGSTPKAPEERLAALANAKNLKGGYAVLVRFARANALAESNKPADAAKAFDELAADNSVDRILRDVATMKSAFLQADTLSYSDLKTRLARLSTPESAFRFSAQELLGYSAFRAGDLTTAQSAYQSITSDLAAPPDIRQRASDMLSEVEQRLPAAARSKHTAKPTTTQPAPKPH